MAKLFTPLMLGSVEVPNRIAIAPMCQYTADDGSATDWHLQHLMTLAMSGAGLVTVEATAVERIGRITHGDLGLYSDANERALRRALEAAKAVALPGTKFAIQIAHAGRKASSQRPWEGGGPLSPAEDPWGTVAPSAVAFDSKWHTPTALDAAGVERIAAAFLSAAQRAIRIGFDVIELHFAHGYLMHEFQSPLSNQRSDGWGGSADKRRALHRRIAAEVQAAAPSHVAVGARISGSDWVDGGLTPDDAVALAQELKAIGIAFACVTSGGIVPYAKIAAAPLFQVPFATRIKQETGMTARAVGMITTAEEAEGIIASGAADQVAVARVILDNPRWPWHVADRLGVSLPRPPQYARVAPALWPPAKALRAVSAG